MNTNSQKITWPLSIRIIHWVVAVIFLINAFILDDGDTVHVYIGYLAFALVFIRIVMGFTCSGHVAFKNFPLSFNQLITFLPQHLKRQVHYEGHNPFAALVYIFIWLGFIGLTISGYMLGLDAYWGDETVESIHSLINDGLIILVVLHIAGIALDSLLYKRKSWMGMIK